MRVLAVVPARGGSKGLSGKNVRPLAGIPLLGHSLRAAELIESVTRCVVSTDSPEIADIARELGGDVPFLRPAALATDDTPLPPVLRHALAAVEEQEHSAYDMVILLEPPSPIRVPGDIDAAVRTLMRRSSSHSRWDGVVSVSRPTFDPVWLGVQSTRADPEQLERYFPDAALVSSRQELPTYLRINGNFCVWHTGFVRRMRTSWIDQGAHGMVEIPEARAMRIDYRYDFDLLEAILAQGLIKLPWLRSAIRRQPPVLAHPGLTVLDHVSLADSLAAQLTHAAPPSPVEHPKPA